MWQRLAQWAQSVRRDVLTLWYAARHPGTPMVAKLLAGCVVAYAFSPIDLIPDFIPVLGLLDDAIILPLGILLVVRLVPAPVLAACRHSATQHLARALAKPRSWIGMVVILILWTALAVLSVAVARHWIGEPVG